jgi:hypothetical protein
MDNKKELIKYIRSLGLQVNTGTKARGHQGFFIRNRIDVSKNIPENRIIPTLLHEFAHYIHSKIEPDMNRTGGNLDILFGVKEDEILEELIKVTNFVDKNSLCLKLYEHKDRIKNKIKEYERVIKSEYPDFMRSKPFKKFDKYIKHSEARYLLKYDRVRIITGFWRKKQRLLSVTSIEEDFPDMPKSFAAYIRLKSAQKKQSRVTTRISKLHKYYSKPNELFARFVEGLYLDKAWVCALAPKASKLFFERLKYGYYQELENVLELTGIIDTVTSFTQNLH